MDRAPPRVHKTIDTAPISRPTRSQTANMPSAITVVVKWQAEEVGKRTPDKLRAQGNYKHKTRAIKKARSEIKSKKTLEAIYG